MTVRGLYEQYLRDPNSLLDGSDYVPICQQQMSLAKEMGQTVKSLWNKLR